MKNFKTIFVLSALMFSWLIGVNNSSAATLATTLKGRILLQVEQNGEAWYVNPTNELRYYLGRPADAFNVMRELGLGISNKDFDSFNGYAPSRLSGRILLKVADSGKAYYVNTNDLKMYYLGRPADAFNVMRELGLGITDKNLGLIGIAGEKLYLSQRYGVAFSYPNNFYLLDNSTKWDAILISEAPINFPDIGGTSAPISISSLNSQFLTNELNSLESKVETTVTVNGISARRIEGVAANVYDKSIKNKLLLVVVESKNLVIRGFEAPIDRKINFNLETVFDQMISTFRFTDSVNATGIIKSVYGKSGKNYIDIDYVELNSNWVPGGTSGSAYQNNNPLIRTFEISSNAKFIVGSPATNSITFSDFQKYFVTSDTSVYQKYNPWDMVIVNGVVNQITEHFVP